MGRNVRYCGPLSLATEATARNRSSALAHPVVISTRFGDFRLALRETYSSVADIFRVLLPILANGNTPYMV
jgi:hypothetical protein